MKKILLLLLITSCFSFYQKKRKSFIPPGTVQITETFFADETEVSNWSWREYESWIKTKYGANSPEHLATLPDTAVWSEKNTYNGAYITHYYRHTAYKDYPVVGVSYEQVKAFCKWRTERVKEFYAIAYKKNVDIEYRLPTKQEWELISNNGGNVFSNSGRTAKGEAKLNCVREDTLQSSVVAGSADVTAPVYSYWKNWFGLFNTIGNVAEMTQEEGLCKGGSWRHRIEDCRAGKDLSYTKPEPWLGFRCVCSVK